MKLSELLKDVEVLQTVGGTDVEVQGIQFDSRRVGDGDVFVAQRGTTVDGHTFIAQCVEKGARAVVLEDSTYLPGELKMKNEELRIASQDTTYVLVRSSDEALGRMAHTWYGEPSKHLHLVGVTGTNGKTTTATLLYRLTRALGHKAGLLSTVINYVDDQPVEATHTTPDALELNALLARMVSAGCEYAFMEVSSHAIAQERIAGLQFAGALFTNLTRDHLDFHKTVEAYIKAKKMFFDGLPTEAFALINADDKVGSVMVQNCKAKTYSYSLRTMADFKAQVIEERLDGTTITLNGQELEVLFTGRFNVYNLASVYGAALLLGFSKDEVLVKISMLHPVAGRFQTMRSPRGYVAVVDYAHTPDALVNVLTAINDVVCGKGQIITVCGCGGDRDHGKRPMMAAEAAGRSDLVILTSDNPRSEDPEEILRQMEAGLDETGRSRTLKITDRREAIRAACRMAKKGDVVLVAGKGHETYQEIKGVKHHFDDREVLADIFKEEEK